MTFVWIDYSDPRVDDVSEAFHRLREGKKEIHPEHMVWHIHLETVSQRMSDAYMAARRPKEAKNKFPVPIIIPPDHAMSSILSGPKASYYIHPGYQPQMPSSLRLGQERQPMVVTLNRISLTMVYPSRRTKQKT